MTKHVSNLQIFVREAYFFGPQEAPNIDYESPSNKPISYTQVQNSKKVLKITSTK